MKSPDIVPLPENYSEALPTPARLSAIAPIEEAKQRQAYIDEFNYNTSDMFRHI